MSRFSRQILILIIVAAAIALLVFMLLMSDSLNILSLLPYQIASMIIGLLTMLALIPTILLVQRHPSVWRMYAAFATPVIIGSAGMLFNTTAMLLVNSELLPVIFFLVALNFFFMVLRSGGLIMLLTTHIRLQNCENREPVG